MLDNGLQVLVISDPWTDKSAAAVDVRVGSWSDPSDIPGLAHFCEHMLFLGTEKYPKEDEYNTFLHNHGGSSNAFTATEDTNYYFSVDQDALHGALDRFAQFFISPLFTESATKREQNAVDSEHKKNLQNDGWRMWQLLLHLSNPEHALNRFSTGDINTLDRPDIRQRLLDFHKSHYAANTMTLTVLGRESLETLSNWVFNIFSSVPYKPSINSPKFYGFPFGDIKGNTKSSFVGRWIDLIPIKPGNKLTLVWQVFSLDDTELVARTKPQRYISSFLGHEGAGSLLSALKDAGWATAISAGPQLTPYEDYSLFAVEINLTELGFSHANDVMRSFFQYLKKLEVNKSLWNEDNMIRTLQFTYREPGDPADVVSELAKKKQKIEPKGVIDIEDLLEAPQHSLYGAVMIRRFVALLKPENVNVFLSSDKYTNSKTESIQSEPVYGTKYSVRKIKETEMARWTAPPSTKVVKTNVDDVIDALHLPPKNDYVPDPALLSSRIDAPSRGMVSFISPDNENFNGLRDHSPPKLIRDTFGAKVYWKHDNTFNRPLVMAKCRLLDIGVYETALPVSGISLLIDLIKDSLNEEMYLAENAGFSYDIGFDRRGITFQAVGYSDMNRFRLFLGAIMKSIVTIDTVGEKSHFEALKERRVKELEALSKKQPYAQAIRIENRFLNERSYSVEELISATNIQTFESVISIEPSFFLHKEARCFVYGNLSEEEALDLVDVIDSNLKIKTENDEEDEEEKEERETWIQSPRIVELEAGTSLGIQASNENEEDVNSSTLVTFEIGRRDGLAVDQKLNQDEAVKRNVLVDLLANVMKTPVFDVLRTKEQLGYLVFSFPRRLQGIMMMNILVQSGKYSAKFLGERINNFVMAFPEDLKNIKKEDFDQHIETLIQEFREKDVRMSDAFDRFWGEIDNETFIPRFNRVEMLVNATKELTQNDLIEFYQKYFVESNVTVRKLSIEISSVKNKDAIENKKDVISKDVYWTEQIEVEEAMRSRKDRFFPI
eukprot:g4838.t1